MPAKKINYQGGSTKKKNVGGEEKGRTLEVRVLCGKMRYGKRIQWRSIPQKVEELKSL